MRYTSGNAERSGYDGVYKALGDEHRLQILRLLSEKEMSAGELLASLDIVQSTLSHHMRVLTASGVVSARRSGKWTIYSVNMEALRQAADALMNFLEEARHAGKSEIAARAEKTAATGRDGDRPEEKTVRSDERRKKPVREEENRSEKEAVRREEKRASRAEGAGSEKKKGKKKGKTKKGGRK